LHASAKRIQQKSILSALDSTAVPPIVCNQPDDVAEVTALDGFRLLVRFYEDHGEWKLS
jgi:hypothetical protein